MQNFLYHVVDIVVLILHWLTILVLLWGTALALREFVVSRFRRKDSSQSSMETLHHIKNNLGGYVLLGLEILIVADIIDSVAQPTFEDIARLAAMVAIRTVISYFLNKEIHGEEENAK